jgi:signal peptidase I
VDWLITLLLTVLIVPFFVLFLIRFVMRAFFVVTPSMTPTLRVGDRVLVSILSYRLRKPRRGDIIVFFRRLSSEPSSPGEPRGVRWRSAQMRGYQHGRFSIKRVVAVGGQNLIMKHDEIFLDGVQLSEPYLLHVGQTGGSRGLTIHHVSHGAVFVMGDDRYRSKDSRHFGDIPVDSIVGRVVLVFWPPAHVKKA